MIEISLDAFKTLGIALIFLLIGRKLRADVGILNRFAIPSPVIGGTLFALIALVLKLSGFVSFTYNESFKNLFMTMFFCSVGFNASFKILKQGGKKVFIFLIAAVFLCILQNAVAIFLAPYAGADPALAFLTGSTAMTGGHGTSGAIAPMLEERYGIAGATTFAMTAATFGLVAGSLIGGPIGTFLIERHKFVEKEKKRKRSENPLYDLVEKLEVKLSSDKILDAFIILLIAVGVGTYLTDAINMINPNFQMPIYTGPMILGIILRNVLEGTRFEVPNDEIQSIGNASLQIFLAVALMTLKLWELIHLAGPLIILLLAQIVLMILYSIFVTFNIMGRDYDAAILAGGHCGFGMGATPNGIANMESLTEKYIPSPMAFFVLPIVGSFFIDFINVLIINLFLPIVV